LEKEGLKVLAQHFHWDKIQIKTLSFGRKPYFFRSFPHEAGIVELASLEAQKRVSNSENHLYRRNLIPPSARSKER